MVSGALEEDKTLLPNKTKVMATVIQKNGPRKNLVAFIYLRGSKTPSSVTIGCLANLPSPLMLRVRTFGYRRLGARQRLNVSFCTFVRSPSHNQSQTHLVCQNLRTLLRQEFLLRQVS